MEIENKYVMPLSLTDSLEEVRTALEARAAADKALAQNKADIATAQSERQTAQELCMQAEVDLALAMDASKAKGMEAALLEAEKVFEDKEKAVARLERIAGALTKHAYAADNLIAEAKLIFTSEINQFGTDVGNIFADELAEALIPLVQVLKRGQALREALRLQNLTAMMFDIFVDHPCRVNSAFIQGETVLLPGHKFNLRDAWREDDSPAAEIYKALSAIPEVRKKLSAHTPFGGRQDKWNQPATHSGYSIGGSGIPWPEAKSPIDPHERGHGIPGPLPKPPLEPNRLGDGV